MARRSQCGGVPFDQERSFLPPLPCHWCISRPGEQWQRRFRTGECRPTQSQRHLVCYILAGSLEGLGYLYNCLLPTLVIVGVASCFVLPL